MIKAKFRDHVRSKTDVAMKNEVLCKVLCHNICCLVSAIYELGITPTFPRLNNNQAVSPNFASNEAINIQVDEGQKQVLAPVQP